MSTNNNCIDKSHIITKTCRSLHLPVQEYCNACQNRGICSKKIQFYEINKQKIDKHFLICHICKNFQMIPASLRECGHSFCLCCLEKYYTTIENEYKKDGNNYDNGNNRCIYKNKKRYKCPTCDQPFTKSDIHPNHDKRRFLHQNILPILENESYVDEHIKGCKICSVEMDRIRFKSLYWSLRKEYTTFFEITVPNILANKNNVNENDIVIPGTLEDINKLDKKIIDKNAIIQSFATDIYGYDVEWKYTHLLTRDNTYFAENGGKSLKKIIIIKRNKQNNNNNNVR